MDADFSRLIYCIKPAFPHYWLQTHYWLPHYHDKLLWVKPSTLSYLPLLHSIIYSVKKIVLTLTFINIFWIIMVINLNICEWYVNNMSSVFRAIPFQAMFINKSLIVIRSVSTFFETCYMYMKDSLRWVNKVFNMCESNVY